MDNLSQRLKDVFGPRPDEHDWCDTTRLANPWSVLLGRPRHARPQSERSPDRTLPAEAGADTERAGNRPLPDLREASQPPAGKDGR